MMELLDPSHETEQDDMKEEIEVFWRCVSRYSGLSLSLSLTTSSDVIANLKPFSLVVSSI